MVTKEERDREANLNRGMKELRIGLGYVNRGLTELSITQSHLERAGMTVINDVLITSLRLLSEVVDKLFPYSDKRRR